MADKLFDQVEGIVQIKEEKRADVLLLRFVGRLDALSTPEAEKKVLHSIDLGSSKILMDFSGVDYISSAGMRMLLAVAKRLKTQSGKLTVCSITTNVMDVFKMSGFDHVLDLTPSEEEAFKRLSE